MDKYLDIIFKVFFYDYGPWNYKKNYFKRVLRIEPKKYKEFVDAFAVNYRFYEEEHYCCNYNNFKGDLRDIRFIKN